MRYRLIVDARIENLLSRVMDPEIPVLSVLDLGVVRKVEASAGRVALELTPTYTACPANEVIERRIRAALEDAGYSVDIRQVLAPPWTTDWISPAGRKRLREAGIAPPSRRMEGAATAARPACPLCGACETERISQFGSTPCKALHRCLACLEPFDYFKCL